ncbi:glycosyltransferase family 39 protein [Hyphomicrobium sp. LHD-15]|uniref:ArnT family glycosyltransferase n=1 Tax=Hyphomicrobium sp. LHD-15 TaxID=3072142 RepID=UPI00280E25CD|nr:glycosyltransferase family 39 protein [Hyphomicrobium sp. LHD-15]MDQ8700068.1 glycosyltransferase family 39 protein [Hyphomicrobium sp. LHD-15]
MDLQQEYANRRPADTQSARERIEHVVGSGNFLTFLALLAFITAFRLATLAVNGTDLYMDEAQYWAWSLEPALGYFSKPPFIAWIIHGATSVCGDSEACIRLPSVALHGATAILIYLIGWRLYSAEVGFWAGLGYALLPAVSLSSGIISTDVPLLAAWALALFAFAGLMQAPSWSSALLLALALGVGLNAKYAMAYFFACAAIYFVIVPERRTRLLQPHLWLALVGGIVLIVPNLLWNVENGFVTVSHTAENANWRGVPFHPGKAAEFIIAQFGVFGPILFGALIAILWRLSKRRQKASAADKLLLAFSVPILAAVTAQAFASRAHANWAAPAYVAAVVLVTAVMIRDRAWVWMRASFAIHATVAVLLALATWQAGHLALPLVGDPFARTLGNRELAAVVKEELAKSATKDRPIKTVLTDDRDIAAALAYYGRDIAVPVLSWREGPAPRNHFEIAKPFSASAPQPVLLVSLRAASPVVKRFGSASPAHSREVSAGRHSTRTLYLVMLDRFQER